MLVKIMIPYTFFLIILVAIYCSYVFYNKKKAASVERVNNFMVSTFCLKNDESNCKSIEVMMRMSVDLYIDEFVSLRKKISSFEQSGKIIDTNGYSTRIDAIKSDCEYRLEKLPRNSVKECFDSIPKLKKSELIDVMFDAASPLVSSFSKI